MFLIDTLPSKIATGLWAFTILLLLIGISAKIGFAIGIVVTILIVPFALLYIYDINCTFTGQCDVWGWIKTILLTFSIISTIVTFIIFLAYAPKLTGN